MRACFVGKGVMGVKERKGEPKSNLDFGLMLLTYKFRDILLPRVDILKEAGVGAGL